MADDTWRYSIFETTKFLTTSFFIAIKFSLNNERQIQCLLASPRDSRLPVLLLTLQEITKFFTQ